MSHLQNQYGATTVTPQTDEYGNPIQHSTTTTGGHMSGGHGGAYDTTGGPTGVGYGTTGGTGTGTFDTGLGGHQQQRLHRSGSSGSSSSEDDGQGGRRKKGLKQKIKEKLPGHHDDQGQQGHVGQTYGTSTTTAPGVYHETEHHEKKGIMEKIKEKLPGGGGGHHE
ncbi:hypothetical protein CsatB_024642 [Cannabis sativa]